MARGRWRADPRVADLAARTVVAPREVPAGVLTALIGAPYLLGLLILGGRRAGAQGDDDARARRRARRAFSAFARGTVRRTPHDVVWLGMPDDAHDLRRAGLSYPSARCPITARQSSTRWSAITAAIRRSMRALMSQWSKYYFGRAAPAGVVAALTLGRPLDMSPERVRRARRRDAHRAVLPARCARHQCDDRAYAGKSRISAR